jgi:hypothetical protein
MLALMKLFDVKFDCRDNVLEDEEALPVDVVGRVDVGALVAKLVVSGLFLPIATGSVLAVTGSNW